MRKVHRLHVDCQCCSVLAPYRRIPFYQACPQVSCDSNHAVNCSAVHLIGVGANSLVAGGAGVATRRNGALTPVQRVDGPPRWRFAGTAEGRQTMRVQPPCVRPFAAR